MAIHIALVVIVFVVLWLVPIPLGIGSAIRKHYSPYWMWFGLHPLGGWIAFIVLASLPGRVVCGHCGGHVGRNFRVCPYCHTSMCPASEPHSHAPAAEQKPPEGEPRQ